MSGTDLRPEDFAEWDWDIVSEAGAELMGVVADLSFHHCSPGDGWWPTTKFGDTPELIAEVRSHLDVIEAAVKKARADLAGVERNARLAARRRQRAEKKDANLRLSEEAEGDR